MRKQRAVAETTVLNWNLPFLVLIACCWALHAGGASARFAMIGDYGADDANELAVANLVNTQLQPDFIVTTGDNNYGTAADYDRSVGKYYHAYIGNYMGGYGTGASSNRFFPAIGNHDFFNDNYAAYLEYFTLPGNERYYDFAAGPIHFYMMNNDVHEPHGTSSGSAQAQWLSNRLANTSAPWKLVIIHHPPYSSAASTPDARWPFHAWGASAVISGHQHTYERLLVDNLPYFVNGLGGSFIFAFGSPVPGSQVRYNAAHGAMLVLADDERITFQFHSVANGGSLIDSLSLTNPPRPRLNIVTLPSGTNKLSWSTNTPGFVLEACSNLVALSTWSAVPGSPAIQMGEYVMLSGATESRRYFRLRSR